MKCHLVFPRRFVVCLQLIQPDCLPNTIDSLCPSPSLSSVLAMLAFSAAEAEDAEEIFDLGETVYNSCNACHGVYWIDDADRGRAVTPEP